MKTIEPMKGSIFTHPIPLWEDAKDCPECGSDQIFALNFGIDGWHGCCSECGHSWPVDRPDRNESLPVKRDFIVNRDIESGAGEE